MIGSIALLLLTIFNLKASEITVELKYSMMACENCNHFYVIASDTKEYVGKIFVPASEVFDFKSIVEEVVVNNKRLCAVGRPYQFNPNLFGIAVDAIRFKVANIISDADCISYKP